MQKEEAWPGLDSRHETNKEKEKMKKKKKRRRKKKKVVGLIHSLRDRQRGRFGKGEKKGDSYQKGKVNATQDALHAHPPRSHFWFHWQLATALKEFYCIKICYALV